MFNAFTDTVLAM